MSSWRASQPPPSFRWTRSTVAMGTATSNKRPTVGASLLHLLRASRIEPGPAKGLGLAEPRPPVVGRRALEVIPQLRVELGLEPAPMDEATQEPHQAPPSRAARTRLTASESRRQSASSAASRARPFAVSRLGKLGVGLRHGQYLLLRHIDMSK